MRIAIAADHAGFSLKQILLATLRQRGNHVTDLGAANQEPTDYPDYAAAVGRGIVEGRFERGVLVCGSGVGMSIAANKISGIRAAVAMGDEQVKLTRQHNDLNVLTLGAKFTSAENAIRWVELFLSTSADGGERHARRIQKIAGLEAETRLNSEVYVSR